MIHPTAIIHPDASIHPDCEIGPFCIVEEGTSLGEGCRLHPHVIIRKGSRLGAEVVIHPFAVIGGRPQDVSVAEAIESGVVIGDGTVIRENVTVNRSGKDGFATTIGETCYLMAGSHVAHDCVLGNRVILANDTMLAGHVQVGDHVFLGGGCGIHQFCRIGESVMVGGHASITMDLPPFLMVAERNHISGLNLVGLKRRGLNADIIGNIKACFRAVYADSGNPREKAAAALRDGLAECPESTRFLEFFAGGKRGIARWTPGGG